MWRKRAVPECAETKINPYFCTEKTKRDAPGTSLRATVKQVKPKEKEMKKFLLMIAVALVSVAASAQVYVGGEVSYWRNHQDNNTTFSIAPEVGYTLSDKWGIGVSLEYAHNYTGLQSHLTEGQKVNSFSVNPYARYTYAKLGPVNLFLDGGFEFATAKIKDADDSYTAWNIGIKPGVAVNLTKKLSFVAHVGFLGYQDADDELASTIDRGFGFHLSGNDLKFGLYYNF